MPGRSEAIHFHKSGGYGSLGRKRGSECCVDRDDFSVGVDDQGTANRFADLSIPQCRYFATTKEFRGRLDGKRKSFPTVHNATNRECICTTVDRRQSGIVNISYSDFRVKDSFSRGNIRSPEK